MSVAAAIGNASRTGPERTALLTLSPVVAATLFNAVLCFLFTRGLPVSAATVAACEIAITAAALFLGRDAIGETVLIALLGLYRLRDRPMADRARRPGHAAQPRHPLRLLRPGRGARQGR